MSGVGVTLVVFTVGLGVSFGVVVTILVLVIVGTVTEVRLSRGKEADTQPGI